MGTSFAMRPLYFLFLSLFVLACEPPPISAPTPAAQVEPDPRPCCEVPDDVFLEEREMILLGTAETLFRTDQKNRAFNVRLATGRVDQVEIEPGQEFSFNEVVGPRTAEQGFRPAPAIFLGELVDDIGGGTCQVSSTLFGAVLDAQLDIIERRPHSRVVKYAGPGRDATVAFSADCVKAQTCIDFKFKNTYSKPVLIEARTTQVKPGRARLRIEILGYADERGQVASKWVLNATKDFEKRFRKLEGKPDEFRTRKQKGEQGLAGVLVVRQESPSGEVREARIRSTYPPVDEVWEVGPGWDETMNPWESP